MGAIGVSMSVSVLIVDDSAFFRKRVAEILNSVSDIKVVGAASNGKEAVELVKKLSPDVVTMDYEMPVMDGITAVRHIMAEHPTPILMFSSLTYEGARVTLDALDAGAVDFLPKNFEDIARDAGEMQEVLKNRILTIAKKSKTPVNSSANYVSNSHEPVSNKATPHQNKSTKPTHTIASRGKLTQPSRSKLTPTIKPINHPVDLLVIGASTGGPVALQKVLAKLPANFPLPILVVQHMPATFTAAFAERLDGLCAITVRHGADGDFLKKGTAVIAPGAMQMIVSGKGRQIGVLSGDERLTYKPSVDITFGSAAKAFPGRVLAVVLTGMGADGREGCRLLKQSGSTVYTQSEKSCVIYGMPMAVDKAGYADASFDIEKIAEQIIGGVK